jgi:hypothetical protein
MLSRVDDGEDNSAISKDNKKRPVTGGDTLMKAFVHMHEKCPPALACPLKFITLLKNYVIMYKKKKGTISSRFQRLQVRTRMLLYNYENNRPVFPN